MKRGQEKGAGFESREPTMEDALVTHDGLHGHTPRKRCISTPTRRKTWRRLGGAARGLTDVSLCPTYATSITPILLYLLLYISRHHLCFVARRRIRRAPGAIATPSSALSVLFLFYFFLLFSPPPLFISTISFLLHAAAHVKLGRRRTLIVSI